MTYIKIEIENNEIVSVSELNEVLKYVDLNNNLCLELSFKKNIKKFDIVSIAGLYLLHIDHNITFRIVYPNEISDNRIFEVRHYLKQIENLFGKTYKSVFKSFKGISELKEDEFNVSTSFAPILYINKDTYSQYFISTLKELDPSLQIVKFCNEYISGVKKRKINRVETNYLDSNDSIFNELKNYTPLHTIIFSILYHKINPFIKTKKKGIQDPIKRTKELFSFTQEYIKGLDELAKNIIEHSTTENGIITIRTYDIEENSMANGKVFQTHVFDFGKTGIIDKLTERTETNKDKSKIYIEDLEILRKGYSLKDFIIPTVQNKLNQQLYRDIAHYGLTKFYKLIQKNEGNVLSSTSSITKDRDFYSTFDKSIEAIRLGTNYFFEMPFKPDLFVESDEKKTLELPQKGTAQTISGLSKILKFKIVKNLNEVTSELHIYSVSPILKISNREEEQNLFKQYTCIKDKDILKYIFIDMKEISLSTSSLLRFMAHLSSNYLQSFIFYNIDFKLYDEMISDNKSFYESVKDINRIPYWYENRSILIFSSIRNGFFHFADILFGKNEEEFNSINQIVSHTFPNTNSILTKEKIKVDNFTIPKSVSSFFHQSTLLPFDILLLDNQSNSLFQANLLRILDNNINKVKDE